MVRTRFNCPTISANESALGIDLMDNRASVTLCTLQAKWEVILIIPVKDNGMTASAPAQPA